MRSFLLKTRAIIVSYAQLLLVLLAFTLMVVSSYIFVSNTERNHLRRNVQDAIRKTELTIRADLLEPETLLGGISETIRAMVMLWADLSHVDDYIKFINEYILQGGGNPMEGAIGFFGVFEAFGGHFLSGDDNWLSPEDFDPSTRPWYIAAVEANGEIAVTRPYVNIYSGDVTLTFSRRIFADNGIPLGIVGLNVQLDRIRDFVINTKLTEGGYGFLLGDNLEVIAHPNPLFTRIPFRGVYESTLLETGEVSEVTTTDNRGIQSIVFVRKIYNGWYLGILTPKAAYFHSTFDLAVILSVLGAIFAAPLIWILMRLSNVQKKMTKLIEQRTHLLDMVNNAAAILLSSNNTDTFETSLLKSLAIVGQCMEVDRVLVWRNEMIDEDLQCVLSYEWLSDFGKTCVSAPIGLKFPYKSKKEWKEMFLRGECINAPLSKLPEEDRVTLGSFNIKSVVIIPIFLEDSFWGLFSVDDCRNERVFSTEEVSILTSAGLMISSATNRNIQTLERIEAEKRTQVMIDSAPFCVIFWDKNLNLIDCNQETVNMFELSGKQDFLDKFSLLSPEYQPDGILSKDKGVALVNKALQEGYSRFEWLHQKPTGEPIPVEVICIRVKHKGEFTVTEYMRDLREQKAMMEEMRKAEIAEDSSKAKSDFLAKMSHEIRTPMNAILGIAEIQLQDKALSDFTKEAMERIYSSGSLLLGIINDILDLSKIEAGKLEIVPVKYDIASLINDTVQLNIMRYESRPIEFVLNVDAGLPLMLVGDELRIKQILNNILSNAFKYTDEGMVNLVVSSEPVSGQALADDDEEVMINFSIIDTGQGMTPEQVKRLGAEYSRFNMEANRNREGTGLGMNITMNLIKLMNGTISIDSTPGMGSTFTVRLSQKRSGIDTIGEELAENLMRFSLNNASKIRTMQLKRDFMPYGRVLVVDDVETNLYVARGLMAPYGLSIDTAMSGFEAIDKVRSGSVYDIIFMDHMMPKMDGIEATQLIRSLGYNQPVVALTANALAGQAEMFLKSGFDDYISKPIDIRQLNASLNNLIRNKQSPEVLEEARRQKDIISNSSSTLVSSQLAEFFIRDAKKALTILEGIYLNKGLRNDDVSMFIINTHAMKSALANIGEINISEEAGKLEQAGRNNDLKLIMSELPLFMENLYAVINKLEENKNSEKSVNADGAEVDLSRLNEILLAVQAACTVYNKKAAKTRLAELNEMTLPSGVNELLSALNGYLLHSEFDEAVKAIGDYLQQTS